MSPNDYEYFSLWGWNRQQDVKVFEHICRRKYSEIALDKFLMGDYDFIAIHCP